MSMQCLGGQHPAFVLRKLTLQRKELELAQANPEGTGQRCEHQ